MSKPVINLKTVEFFMKLEKDFHLLSGDMIDQEDLFEIQERICEEIVNAVNADKTGHGVKLLATVPYLFNTTVTEVKS